MKILLINSNSGPDYLADLVIGEAITNSDYQVYTNRCPSFLFSDFEGLNKIYGHGYTVYGKIDPTIKGSVKILASEELKDYLNSKFFDFIIYTSIWRCSDFIQEVFLNYDKSRIFAIDGEDHTNVLDISKKTVYFKRELLESFKSYCLPISFSFPSFNKLLTLNNVKTNLLAPCVAGFVNSYQFNTERSYYSQYSSSLFGLTTKKGGWDCMRHYEIIKCGSVPYFPGILLKPPLTMQDYPVRDQIEANHLFEFLVQNPGSISGMLEKINSLQARFSYWQDFSRIKYIKKFLSS